MAVKELIGPEVFLTDDSRAERQALNSAFPDATLVLCVFHVLQAFWRHVWDSKHGIAKNDRPHLFGLMTKMVYSETEEDLSIAWESIQKDPALKKYGGAASHMAKVYAAKESWAICYRKSLLVRGNHTNNYCEAAMRILKDKVFMRMKAFNIRHLVDFLTSKLEAYYEQRLIDYSNNRMANLLHSRYQQDIKYLNQDNVLQINESTYEVPSASKDQTVSTLRRNNCTTHFVLLSPGLQRQHGCGSMYMLHG